MKRSSQSQKRVITVALFGIQVLMLPFGHLGLSSKGQERDLQLPPITLRSDLVTVSVTVFDRKGNPRVGLKKEDFDVFDNDHPRPIFYFNSESSGSSLSRPLSIALLVDASGSVATTLEQQRSAARSLISGLGEATKAALLEFSTVTREVVGLTPDKQQLLRAFEHLKGVGGGTAILDAMLVGLRVLAADADPRPQKLVLVLTDGLDTASRATAEGCIRRADETGVSVYGIQIPIYAPIEGRLAPRPASRAWLRVIAATGGRVWQVGSAREAIDPRFKPDLSPVFLELLAELQSQYLLGFYPDERGIPGYHALKVRVKAAGVGRIRHRLGYWYNRPTS